MSTGQIGMIQVEAANGQVFVSKLREISGGQTMISDHVATLDPAHSRSLGELLTGLAATADEQIAALRLRRRDKLRAELVEALARVDALRQEIDELAKGAT